MESKQISSKSLNYFIARYTLCIVGIILAALGLAAATSISNSWFGPFPGEFFTVNLSNYTKVSLSVATIIFNCLFFIPLIFFLLIFKKMRWEIFLGIIPILIFSFPLEFFLEKLFIPISNQFLWLDLILYISGAVLAGIGFAFFQASNIMNFPGSELCEFGAEHTKLSFTTYKIISDGVTFLVGSIFFALNYYNIPETAKKIGIGTFFLMLTSGIIIEFTLKIIRKSKLIASFRQ